MNWKIGTNRKTQENISENNNPEYHKQKKKSECIYNITVDNLIIFIIFVINS